MLRAPSRPWAPGGPPELHAAAIPGRRPPAGRASAAIAPLVAQELARDVEPHTLAGHCGEARVSRPTVLPPTTPVGKEAERGAARGFGAPRLAAAAPAHEAQQGPRLAPFSSPPIARCCPAYGAPI